MRSIAALLFTCLLGLTAASQTTKPRTTTAKRAEASKPAASATPKKVDEKSRWDDAVAVAEPTARLAELNKFIEDFPESVRLGDAHARIASTAVEAGAERLQASDIAGAAKLFRTASEAAPSPMPDELFGGSLSKLPGELYFRGERQTAVEIAKILEEKAAASPSQLLAIANFYLSVEGGSEAKRIANKAIAVDANSSAAYEALGLAHRMDFELEQSSEAYSKALELAPDSLTALRGLAEMKRSLGKAAEAVELYRAILSRDASSIPARSGLVLAMFDAGDRAAAEAELTAALEASPNNVMLMGGAAYWYAANGDAAKAIDLARKALDTDPRFIWSHIALARGYLASGNTAAAERTLLAARRYGNFPTLEYEIASARLSAGLYREAAEELAKSFEIVDGAVRTKLGGRVDRSSANITELVGYERRASIFAPTAADSPEASSRLVALLELKQELGKAEPAADAAVRAADNFIKGDDKMKVHRQVFSAAQLLDKKVALDHVIELARQATANLDNGLDVPSPATTIMASELYEARTIAAVRNEYVNVPDVPRATLSAILRGRIEEINGWAAYQMQQPDEAILRLRRAISVLPVNSAWWRSSTWRLGSALELAGKGSEALDMYIKSYKSGGTSSDTIKYSVISSLYQRLNGSTDGLQEKIDSIEVEPAAQNVAQKAEPEQTPTSTAAPEPEVTPVTAISNAPFGNRRIPSVVPIARPASPSPTPVAVVDTTPEPTPEPAAVVDATNEPTQEPAVTESSLLDVPAKLPEAVPESSLTEDLPASPVETPDPSPEPTPEPAAEFTPEAVTPEQTPEAATPEPTPDAVTPEPTPEALTSDPTPEAVTADPTPEASLDPTDTPMPEASPEPNATPMPEVTPDASPGLPPEAPPDETNVDEVSDEVEPSPEPSATPAPSQEPSDQPRSARSSLSGDKLFPPVVITIPQHPPVRTKQTDPQPAPTLDAVAGRVDEPTPPDAERVARNTEPPRRTRPRVVIEGMVRPVDTKPCFITVSDESISLQAEGRDAAVVVRREDDEDLEGLTVASSSPADVSVRREPITGVSGRALFVLRSVSQKTGDYQVLFEMPCGRKELAVTVR